MQRTAVLAAGPARRPRRARPRALRARPRERPARRLRGRPTSTCGRRSSCSPTSATWRAWARRGTASALLLNQQDRCDEALDHAVEALRLRRSLADSAAVAYSENAVGWILAHLGQPDAALWYCRRALDMHTESGSRSGVADTLDSIAFVYGQLADYERSIAHYEQALAMFRLLGDPQGEAALAAAPRRHPARRGAAGRRAAQLGAVARAARPDSRARTSARRAGGWDRSRRRRPTRGSCSTVRTRPVGP